MNNAIKFSVVALLRLENAVRFRAIGPLRPICLPDSVDDNYDGNRVRYDMHSNSWS